MNLEAEALKQAAGWYARLCSGAATAQDHQDWRLWHDQHPDHRAAWRRIEAVRDRLRGVPAAIAAPTLAAVRRSRRTALKCMTGLFVGGSLTYFCHEELPWQRWRANYRTAVGDQRRLTLADGSLLVLNTDSAVDVAFGPARRLLRLLGGEIFVATAKGATDPRPFEVETAQGTVRALGTRFTVRTTSDETRVIVLQDRVEIRPAHAPGQSLILDAGQQVEFTDHHIDSPGIAPTTAAAWEQGSLIALDWRLEDLVAELARYRRGRLSCDPAVAAIRVSGAFPINDTDKALAALTQSFPVRLESHWRLWETVTRLVPR